MKPVIALALILACLMVATPAAGQVEGFAIVNQTGAALSNVAVRRVGDREWQPLTIAPTAGASARASFTNPDCAFDLRAAVAGAGTATWSGVNLCDVKSVTLNRDRSGRTWVDYD